jgi:hypothetical protein
VQKCAVGREASPGKNGRNLRLEIDSCGAGGSPVVCGYKTFTGQRLRSWLAVDGWVLSGYNRPSLMANVVAAARLPTPILS